MGVEPVMVDKKEMESIIDIDDWEEKPHARAATKSTVASPWSRVQLSESEESHAFAYEQVKLADRYDKIKDLGAGAYGKVGLYRCRRFGNKFAIKSVVADNVKNSAMFERELKLGYTLYHPNIVTAHGFVEEPHAYHLVLDYCRGGDLWNFISGKLAPRGAGGAKVAALFLQQMLSGLAYLHDLNVAHRDVKPENYVLQDRLSDNPVPMLKLIDFGAARTLKDDQELMKTSIGTWEYAAPEMMAGRLYRKSCDIWSLGCTLFALCTRAHPNFAASRDAMLRMILRRRIDITWDEKCWSKHDPRMKKVAQQVLQLDPSARPSANEILNEQRWLCLETAESFRESAATQKACCSVQ
eukprot:TRINITY_DN6686_c0_g1_i1.p1 TRINITY_DN6686_c0_g1~~TRINITY_DN6686_c0_g1_i1.p1  ORF type:complete len:354 (-),score=70.95 TRINITY_DN6686_c0_g1_i1:142-1203(-)